MLPSGAGIFSNEQFSFLFSIGKSAIGFQDLSAELQKEVVDLQKRMAVELQPLVLESTLTMQKILECHDHNARLLLVRHFVEAETKRLKTKKAIQGMFSGKSISTRETLENLASFPPEEQISGGSSGASESSSVPKSFYSDDDAFQ
jgi:hypothetical protein